MEDLDDWDEDEWWDEDYYGQDCKCGYDGYSDYDLEPVDYWIELSDRIGTQFATAIDRFDKTGTVSHNAHGRKWWTLLTPWPAGIEFIVERDVEQISYGLPYRVLSDQRYYIALGDRKWQVYSYLQTADFDKREMRIGALQMPEPPDFGWWMPALVGIE